MSDDERQRVVVTDVKMPFTSMVVFLVKLAIAAIPALIILSVLGALVTAILSALFQGMMGDGPPGELRRF
jgi:hypothetical protein